ncbi:EcsC family protein [Actinacidiphila glaucinigra]
MPRLRGLTDSRTVASDDERGHEASLAGATEGPAGELVPSRPPGRASRARARAKAALNTFVDGLVETAPRVPVRDLETLRRQFPGLGPEELADKLESAATMGTATVGAGIGAAAMLPTPPAMPAELASETLGVALVEYKLIAELHEVYGLRAPGTLRQRSAMYLAEWTERRGIDFSKPSTLNIALGGRMKRELRQQLMKRTMRNLPTLTPFMVGAAVGAVMNRRDTKKLAEQIRKDLRARQVPWGLLSAEGEPPPALGPGG